jgi:hypothetical protein
MTLQMDFTGKHVLVLGGTTGIGCGVAEPSKHVAHLSVVSRKRRFLPARIEPGSRRRRSTFGGRAVVSI